MIIAHCEGILRHQFWGDYSAAIFLRFANAEDAHYAARVLGDGWTVNGRAETDVHGVFVRDELNDVKEKLLSHNQVIQPCGWRHCEGGGKKKKPCKAKEIDATEHSIDYGPAFTLDVDISAVYVDSRQLRLPCLEVSP